MKKYLSLIWLGVFLCIVCAVATAVMGYADLITAGPRAKAQQRKLAGGLKSVLPEFDNDLLATEVKLDSADGIPAVVYTAKKGGKTVAFAVRTATAHAYGGHMEGIVSFSPEGKVLSFLITEHSETPGLGAEVAARKDVRTFSTLFAKKEVRPFPENLPRGKVLDQFRGKSLQSAPWKLKKNGGVIDGQSGATITSAAVCDLASRAARILKENPKKFPGLRSGRETQNGKK